MVGPALVTLTGVDDHTDVNALIKMSRATPVEWGVLFSPSRQGSGRYPSLDFVESFCKTALDSGVRLAAHMCGAAAREIVEENSSRYDYLLPYFTRMQINLPRGVSVNTNTLQAFGDERQIGIILQARGRFPKDNNVAWLLDESGGRGVQKKTFPKSNAWCGYAGGIGPDNVLDTIAAINKSRNNAPWYWIDMETSVRDEDDRLDLAKCKKVLDLVYL